MSRTAALSVNSQEVREKLGITFWDGEKLARFCGIAFVMARKQFDARLNTFVDKDNELTIVGTQKEVILDALMEEIEIVAENLIILALDHGHLKAKTLRHTGKVDTKVKKRTLIITEEVD
jgi:hypothetical protein